MFTDVLAWEAVGVIVRASLPGRVAGVGADAFTLMRILPPRST